MLRHNSAPFFDLALFLRLLCLFFLLLNCQNGASALIAAAFSSVVTSYDADVAPLNESMLHEMLRKKLYYAKLLTRTVQKTGQNNVKGVCLYRAENIMQLQYSKNHQNNSWRACPAASHLTSSFSKSSSARSSASSEGDAAASSTATEALYVTVFFVNMLKELLHVSTAVPAASNVCVP